MTHYWYGGPEDGQAVVLEAGCPPTVEISVPVSYPVATSDPAPTGEVTFHVESWVHAVLRTGGKKKHVYMSEQAHAALVSSRP